MKTDIPLERIRLFHIWVLVMIAVVGLGLAPASGADDKAKSETISYDGYATLLNEYVDDKGLVNYMGLKGNRALLDNFIDTLAKLDPKAYEGWNDNQKIAFWINAYNALTLKAIIDHYPIASSFFKSLVYPENSIRQIPGVWDELEFTVMGRKMTLDGIEHKTLRAKFDEPRIHMALVCAAMGCPKLRTEPYFGDRLDEQLSDQTKKFVSNPDKVRIDQTQKKVYLSSIFKWFGDDFIKKYGEDSKFKGVSASERAVLNFIQPYLTTAQRRFIENNSLTIEYLDYDWSLNEQKT